MHRLLLALATLLFLQMTHPAQSHVNEIGDEQYPELRKELVKRVNSS